METDFRSTIAELVRDAGDRFGDTEALGDGDRSLTFAELRDQVWVAARALMSSGVQPGDRVGLWAPNSIEWVVVALGIHCAGGVLVPVNTRFKGDEAAFVLRKAGAQMVFTVNDCVGTDFAAILHERDDLDLDEIVVLDGGADGGSTPLDDFLGRAERTADEDRAERSAAISSDDLCHIMFTSGTTGSPKGVLLEHGAICTVYEELADVFDLKFGDRQLIVLPFFHSFGFHVGVICGLMRGVTILPHGVFDVDAVMRRLVDDRVTVFPGPPTIFQEMIQSPRLADYDLSVLRGVTIGAAGFPPTLVDELNNVLGIGRVQAGYGLTESSGVVTLCSPPDTAEVITNTVGRAIPGVEIRILLEDGTGAASGVAGEVVVRGRNVMRGYLDDDDATNAAIDPDGWLHTGDIGLVREDGNLVITDRLKDMYTVGGFNAYPAEIENIMAAHDAVAQVAVVGVPDERLGEVGMAFVIRKAGDTTKSGELIGWTRTCMANYKAPRFVEFVDEFPLNATGKVLKPDLRALAQEILDR